MDGIIFNYETYTYLFILLFFVCLFIKYLSKRKTGSYFAGGMEAEKQLGSQWRTRITPIVVKLGLVPLDPCKFEPEQLKGLHPGKLPKRIRTRENKSLLIKHWHQLKYAVYQSKYYKRFDKYMKRIIDYDLMVLKSKAALVICYWTEGAGKGAGTQGEVTTARSKRIPVYTVIAPGVDMPGWIHGCSTKIFNNFEDLFKFLKKEKQRNKNFLPTRWHLMLKALKNGN